MRASRFILSCALGLSLLTAPRPASAQAPDFKVATFNVWGVPGPFSKDPSRFADIPEAIDALGADVVVLQEVFTSAAEAATKSRRYPQVARGPGPGGRLLPSGVRILTRWRILREMTTDFDACSRADCLANKGAVIATIERDDGLQVDVLTTHLNAGGTSSIRARQINSLKKLVDDFESPDHPLVLAGDFNISSTRDRGLYEYLLFRIPSEDTFLAWAGSEEARALPAETRAGITADGLLNRWKAGRGDESRDRLDMILLQNRPSPAKRLRTKSSRVIFIEPVHGRQLSDHFGLETIFEVLD